MGQAQTTEGSKGTGTFVFQDNLHRHAHEMKQAVFSLSYESFLASIQELNSITSSFSDINGKTLVFQVKKGSDRTFLWRGTVRIKCHKVNSQTGSIETSRQLNMKQYIHLYNEIRQQAAMTNIEKQGENPELTASIILTGIDSEQLGANSEKEECCICMDSKSEVILTCSHSYCEKCIDEWNVNHKTCPICRAKVNSKDGAWVLTEKPDVAEMAFETTEYLMALSERCGIKDQQAQSGQVTSSRSASVSNCS